MRIESPENTEEIKPDEPIFQESAEEVSEAKKKKKYKTFDSENPMNVFLYKVGSLILANILFIVCSLPVVTIGASLTALNRVCYQLKNDEDKQMVKTFFSTFAHSLLDATLVWIICAGFASMLAVAIYNLIKIGSGAGYVIGIILCGLLLYCVFCVLMYYFMILSRYDNTITNNIKNAFFVGLTYLPYTVLLALVWVVGIGIFIFIPNLLKYMGWLMLMMGFSTIVYITCGIYRKIFTSLERGSEE